MLVDAFAEVEAGTKEASLYGELAYSSSMKIAILLLASCLMISAALLFAQPEPTPLTNAPKTVASLDPAAATRAWLGYCPGGETRAVRCLFRGRLLADPLEFSAWRRDFSPSSGAGFRHRLRDFAERITRFRTLQVAIFAIAVRCDRGGFSPFR